MAVTFCAGLLKNVTHDFCSKKKNKDQILRFECYEKIIKLFLLFAYQFAFAFDLIFSGKVFCAHQKLFPCFFVLIWFVFVCCICSFFFSLYFLHLLCCPNPKLCIIVTFDVFLTV